MDYIPAKRILTRNKSTDWFGTDHTMNLYRGCPHGCIYCDSRSECYGDDNFDRVKGKENALEILRDADLYADIQARAPVICKLTVTTTDDALAAKIEPGAPGSTRRLKALECLSQRGIFAGVVLMPVLPFLEDSVENVLSVVDAAADAGARFVYPAFGMTLRDRQRDYYYEQLVQHFPGIKEKYERQYGGRYWCVSPRAKELWAAFSRRCGERGLLCEMKHIISAAKRPYGDMQLTFFDM